MLKNYELLSPAGSMEAFYMALANGADAVYLGGEEFSARASAVNFSRDEIVEAVDFAHIRGKKVFVALNILLGEEELDRALEYVGFLWEVGVDALILQDLGMATLVREYFPEFELHASTQMSVLDYGGAQFLEAFGFTRIVVGREIDLGEIEKIKSNTSLEIEAFCHGALCVSVSGQCLMSSMIGGRSGNRGACAQPCRKEYKLVDSKGNQVYDKGYAISPKDLNTIEDLDRLLKAGVYSFKLEGRMKRPDYVAILTHNYASALRGEDFSIEDVKQIFNRTFTRGFSFGEFSHDYISFDRPDNRGVEIGQVMGRFGKNILVKAGERLSKGDLLEFTDKKGRKKTHLLNQDINKGEEARIELGFFPEKGSSFQRVQSQRLKDLANESLDRAYQVRALRGKIFIAIGQKPSFSLEGVYKVVVEGNDPVERAQKKGLDIEKLRENLGKFDKSYFFLQDLDLDVDSEAFLPISVINDLRRRAIEAYEEKLLIKREPREGFLRGKNWKKIQGNYTPKLSVEVRSFDLLKRLDLRKINRVELAFVDRLEEALDYLRGRDVDVYFSLDFHPTFPLKDFLLSLKGRVDGLLVQNLGQVYLSRDWDKVLIGQGLNILNLEAGSYFINQGRDFIVSPEANYGQLEEFTKTFGTCGEIYLYGYQKVMEMKHCPMSLKKSCGRNRDCQNCSFASGYKLEDGRQARFPFLRSNDFTRIYNSVPTYWGNDMKDLQRLYPSMYKLSFSFEEERVEDLVDAFYFYFQGRGHKLQDLNEYFKEKGYTKGHLRKGILS